MSWFENFSCWIRKKDISCNNIICNDLVCGGCFCNIGNIDKFVKIAKCGNDTFGFCSHDCYTEWLKNPSSKYFAPIFIKPPS